MWIVLTKLQGLLNMGGGYSHLKIICIHFQIIWKWTQLALSHKPWGESPWSGTAGFAQPGPQNPCGSQQWQSPFFWELLRTAAIVYFTPEVQWESQRITMRLRGTFHLFAVSSSIKCLHLMSPKGRLKHCHYWLWHPEHPQVLPLYQHLWQPTVHISSAGVITQQAMVLWIAL